MFKFSLHWKVHYVNVNLELKSDFQKNIDN